MYIDKNIIYAEPGKYLVYKNRIAFQLPASGGIAEHQLNIDDMHIKNNLVYYNNDLFVHRWHKNWKYADYKREIIKSRYSNDDQIAIMLNKDDSEEDLLRYERMMQWRVFAATLAHKIINIK